MTPMHPTFGAEITGVDFTKPIVDTVMDEIRTALDEYGVIVLRDTGLSDEQFVSLADSFGEVYPLPPNLRFGAANLADVSNLYLDGFIVKPGDLRWYMAKETALFHVDTSYDPRRVRYTAIIARELPPPGTGGATEFGDTRAAYDDLDEETKAQLEEAIGCHSHLHSRKVALPTFPPFAALEPKDHPMSCHKVAVTHRGTGRKALYIASHLHHIEGMEESASSRLILRLRKMVEQDKYVTKVYYKQPGDVVIWDNTAVVHRAGGNEGEGWSGKHRRDVRKWMTFDNSPEEWGLNDETTPKQNAGGLIQQKFEEIYGKEGNVGDFDEN